MKNRHLILIITMVCLLCSGSDAFGQTHVYITGDDTGNANCPDAPSGTAAANKVTTFYAAIQRANAVGGNVIIHLRTNRLKETSPCPTIKQNVNVQVINDTPYRKAIRFLPEAYKKNHRLIPVNGTLTLGGEGCTSVLIIRGQESPDYYYPYNEDGEDGETIPPVVLIKANEGTVNIDNNCEVCYGKVNVWISYRTGVLNLKPGGVIHSALDMNVNITEGTFNMMGGYIVGHYFTTGNTVPSYGSSYPDNSVLDYNNFVNAHFMQGGTTDYHLDRYAVTNVLDAYYPLDPDDEKSKLNNAIGVYVHDSRDGNGNHLAKFNMSGGSICGFYCSGSKKVIVNAATTSPYAYTYAQNAAGTGDRTVQSQPIYCDGGEFRLSGTAKIYANHAHAAGGAVRITYWNFDKENENENYEHTHAYMTGGEISYCSSGNGGAVRLELGSTLNMSGGKISHCTSVPDDNQIDNPDEAGGGGTGGIRMVSAKLVMSGNAEVEWCSSYTISKAQSGGGIGAVWQNGFGNVATVIELNGGRIHHNYSRGYGGGVSATDKGNTDVVGGVSVTVNGCQIDNNSAGIDGGGVFVGGNTTVEVKGNSTIHNNAATGNGGGLLISTEAVTAPCSLDVASSEIYGNTAANGAGAYVHQGTFNLRSGSYIHDNDASTNGGGVYMDGGEFYHYAGEIGKEYGTNGTTANTAVDGAGVYMNDGTYTMSGGYINGNKASGNGGGVYMGGGTFDFSSGRIGNGSGNYRNTANNGAGVYMADGGTFNMTGGSLEGNYASANGGGVYMASGGICSVTGGNIGVSSSNHNEAQYGAGIFSSGGNITIDGGNVNYNVASESGGGIHCYSGTVYVTSGDITNNSATTYNGGGILANGTVYFSNGNISNNRAAGNGGGVSINPSGALHVSGTATMTGNNAASGFGGGVYQNGTMTIDGTALTVSGNTQGSAKAQVANNVYLPNGKTIAMGSGLNAESVLLGIYTENIAAINQDIPVLTGSASKCAVVYEALASGTSRITDDRNAHRPKYTTGDGIIYFTRVLFDYGPYTDGAPFQNPIDSREQLYKFMCYVNGLNGFTQKHSGQEGIVTANINMRGITHWVPIGEKENASASTTAYTGTFNGNGHIISNLTIDELDDYSNYGLFGKTSNATITNIVVLDCNMTKNEAGNMGSVIGLMQGGTLKNSEGTGLLTSTSNTVIIGGLVGQMASGTIHSSAAMPDMTGYQMGGLAGELASGCSIYNSFANAKFTQYSTSSTEYIGGLVGVNKGKVENCYSLMRGTAPSTTYFGWLAGNNTSETNMGLYYCYAPNSTYVATVSGTTQGNKSGLTTFGTTQTPYLYKHADNQMATVSDNTYIENGAMSTVVGSNNIALKGLLATLNNWVKAHSGNDFSKWMRTSASPINGDYPIHNYTDYVCVGSKDNVALEYSADFNTKFSEYITANSGTIYLYRSPSAAVTSSLSNSSGAPALYIHEDVVMMHTSAIKAHVGITLDNSAGAAGANPSFAGQGYTDYIDWHFFSSALADAPIGLVYGDQTQYEAYHYPSWYAYFNNADGYFPTNFNTSSGGDYYNDWDLYAYYEPDYHWINLKRNSASHWHEDYPGINIPYTNDTEFVPGKGYMVALKEEGYLQAYGTLNTNTGSGSDFIEVPLSYTSDISWTTRQGHNLLGNPYQSYLDFDLFAEYNKGLWGNDKTKAYYIIIDEDQKNYVEYAYGSSENPFGAGRYLHPHQGFMIIVSDSDMFAKFDNRMRNTTAAGVGFRDNDRPNYPLVNLMATDRNGNRDLVTVELGRPDKGGAPKQQALRTSSCSLWCRYEDEDYALVFTQPGLEYANIRFAADEDAEFTMTWSTHNGEFSYLHLIDNMTGADIDCLSTSEYKFSARESDYNSRFRLVFDYTGIEENEDGTSAGSATFAYYANGEIHLTATPDATAQLQIIDMTGRTIVSRDAARHVSTEGLAAGVYVLRLTDGNGTRTQKIILN